MAWPAEDIVVIGLLVDRCPSLLPLLQEHLEDNDELLSHLFFSDVTRWAVSRFIDQPEDLELAAALDLLEREFERGRAGELIAVSFLENLPHKRDPAAGIRSLLGPELARHLNAHLDY